MPVLQHFFGGGLGGQAQLLRAQGLEVAGVKADQVVLALVEPQHLRGDGLQRAQQLAVVLGHQRHIGAAQLDVDHARLEAFGVARAVAGGDAVLEAQSAQLVQGGQKSGNFLGGLLQVVDRHNRQVSQSQTGAR